MDESERREAERLADQKLDELRAAFQDALRWDARSETRMRLIEMYAAAVEAKRMEGLNADEHMSVIMAVRAEHKRAEKLKDRIENAASKRLIDIYREAKLDGYEYVVREIFAAIAEWEANTSGE